MNTLQYLKQWAKNHDFIRRIREVFELFPDRGKRNGKWVKEWVLHGFSSKQTWGLDYRIAQFAFPRLKMLKDVKCGYPAQLTEEEWDAILDDIIYAMEYYCLDGLNDENFDTDRVMRGQKLFGEYFHHLWW